jgi:S1-C subfamily serine protease
MRSSRKPLRFYAVIGITTVLVTFASSNRARNAYRWVLKSYGGGVAENRKTLSAVDLFQRVSPSIFVVQALDDNGKTLILGSGVALAREFLITNCHVIQNSSSLKVSRGKEQWTATLIQAAPNHDLCGIRPSGLPLLPVEVRPSSKLVTGERVYAIGSPEGLELTFSEGVISALRETEGVHMIQTSAPISPGSSGGGLFDAQGNLVGITTFYLKEGQSLNFALPGEWIKTSLDGLTEASRTSSPSPSDAVLESRAWLEIGLQAVEKKEYDLAVHSFHKCTDLEQADAPRAWLELGEIDEMATGLVSPSARAIADFERAIELKPDYAEAWQQLAGAHRNKKEYGQAIAAAKEATRLAPREWAGWAILGDCYTKTESYAEAIVALHQGEKVAPDMPKVMVLALAGRAYAGQGDREQVLRIYRELKATYPKDAEDFFREYVLPRSDEHASKQRSKWDRDLMRILRNAATTDDIRQAAWDAFHAAVNEDDFKRRFDTIPLPEEIRAKLWDLKFGSPMPPTGTPSPN